MSELNDFIQATHERDIKITETLATIKQAQLDLSQRLFGGDGQQGALPFVVAKVDETAKEQIRELKIVSDRTTALEGWRRTSRAYVAGVLAVFTFEGTALGIYFSKIAAHITTLTAIHK